MGTTAPPPPEEAWLPSPDSASLNILHRTLKGALKARELSTLDTGRFAASAGLWRGLEYASVKLRVGTTGTRALKNNVKVCEAPAARSGTHNDTPRGSSSNRFSQDADELEEPAAAAVMGGRPTIPSAPGTSL